MGMHPMRFAFWTLVAITLAIYASMLIWTLPRITAAADGHVPFDMRPGGYSFDDAREFLTCLQPDGRTIYLGPQAVLDLIYPGLLAIVLTISLWTLTRSYRFVVRLFMSQRPFSAAALTIWRIMRSVSCYALNSIHLPWIWSRLRVDGRCSSRSSLRLPWHA